MAKPNTFKASVYVILERDGLTPVFRRDGTTWMQGYYAIASGQAEPGESLKVSAARELEEELGVAVALDDLELVHTQYRYHGAKDDVWIGCYFKASKWQGQPKSMEPQYHSEVSWERLDKLPQPMIPYIQIGLDAWRRGETYSEFHMDEAEVR